MYFQNEPLPPAVTNICPHEGKTEDGVRFGESLDKTDISLYMRLYKVGAGRRPLSWSPDQVGG